MQGLPDAEETSSGRSKSDVGSSVKVDGRLGEHGVVLELRAAESGAVTTDQDKLGLRRWKVKSQLQRARVVPKPKRNSQRPARMALRVLLSPREYLPLLMTSARRELIYLGVSTESVGGLEQPKRLYLRSRPRTWTSFRSWWGPLLRLDGKERSAVALDPREDGRKDGRRSTRRRRENSFEQSLVGGDSTGAVLG